MKPVSAHLPTYQVAAVVKAHMDARQMSTSDVDARAGYVSGGVARRVLRQQHALTDIDTAERLLDAVGGAVWEVPDYQMVGRAKRSIRLRMVACACGCGERTLSHYVDVKPDGKHRWRKKVGLDLRRADVRGGKRSAVFIHGHKSRLPEMRERLRQTTSASWTAERKAQHSATVKAQWTPERRAAHARKIREAAARRRQLTE